MGVMPVSDQMWKQWERTVAKDLGGERTGPRGFSLPDVLLDDLAPECKYTRGGWPNGARWKKWINQAKHNAGLMSKPWAIFFCNAHGNGKPQEKYVILPYADYVYLYQQNRELINLKDKELT